MLGWICRRILRLIGWQLIGSYPSHVKKMIIIAAPHTSSMDFWLALLINYGWRVHGQFYGKEELFSGVRGWFLRSVGGLPIVRTGQQNQVQAIVEDIKSAKRRVIGMTPEGTRRKVEHFKTGFYYIADGAKIPILPVIMDYGHRHIIMRELYYTTGDVEREMAEIEAMYRGVTAKYGDGAF